MIVFLQILDRITKMVLIERIKTFQKKNKTLRLSFGTLYTLSIGWKRIKNFGKILRKTIIFVDKRKTTKE